MYPESWQRWGTTIGWLPTKNASDPAASLWRIDDDIVIGWDQHLYLINRLDPYNPIYRMWLTLPNNIQRTAWWLQTLQEGNRPEADHRWIDYHPRSQTAAYQFKLFHTPYKDPDSYHVVEASIDTGRKLVDDDLRCTGKTFHALADILQALLQTNEEEEMSMPSALAYVLSPVPDMEHNHRDETLQHALWLPRQ